MMRINHLTMLEQPIPRECYAVETFTKGFSRAFSVRGVGSAARLHDHPRIVLPAVTAEVALCEWTEMWLRSGDWRLIRAYRDRYEAAIAAK